jgi:hypothetical protein
MLERAPPSLDGRVREAHVDLSDALQSAAFEKRIHVLRFSTPAVTRERWCNPVDESPNTEKSQKR